MPFSEFPGNSSGNSAQYSKQLRDSVSKFPMTDSTESATTPKSTESKSSQFSVQVSMKPKSQLEFVPRDFKESEFLDLVDFGDVAFSLEAVLTCKTFLFRIFRCAGEFSSEFCRAAR